MNMLSKVVLLMLLCCGIRFSMLSKAPYGICSRNRRETAGFRRRRGTREESAQERIYKRHERIMQDRVHLYYTPYFSKVANPWNDYWGWPYYGMAQGNYGGNTGVVFRNGGMSFFTSNY